MGTAFIATEVLTQQAEGSLGPSQETLNLQSCGTRSVRFTRWVSVCLVAMLVIGVVTALTTPRVGQAASEGLIAAYGFNEGLGTTVNDAAGLTGLGAINGAAWTTGKYGAALAFNGTSNWVTIGSTNALNLTTGMTLEAWVRPSNVSRLKHCPPPKH